MPRPRQPAFVAGEIAPALWYREDLARLRTSAALLENFFVLEEGGATNRPGFEFVADVKDPARTVRLIPFIFSGSQAFVLEFGHLYVRFHTAGGTVEDPLVPGMPLTVVTPYTEAELPRLKFAQQADTVFLAHPSHEIQELRRIANDDWDLAAWTPGDRPDAPTAVFGPQVYPAADDSHPYKFWEWVATAVDADGRESLPSPSFTPRDIQGNVRTDWALYSDKPITLTVAVTPGAVRYNFYRGRNGVFGYIGDTARAATGGLVPFADDGQAPIYGDGPPQATNPFAAAGKYPAVAGFYQGRTVFAGSDDQPQGLEFSRPGQFRNFDKSIPTQEDDAITLVYGSGRFDEIRSVVPLRGLLVLTGAGAFAVSGGQAPLTPSNFDMPPQTAAAASWLDPVLVDRLALYVEDQTNSVRELGYSFEADAYGGPDLTAFARHLFRGRSVVSWAWAPAPWRTLWAVRDDGLLLCLTYNREHEIVAWSRHTTAGGFEQVCAIPEGNETAVYAVVRRTVAGQTRRFLERMASRLEAEVFLDAAIAYDGTVTDGTQVRIDDPDHLDVRPDTTTTPAGYESWNSVAQMHDGDVATAATAAVRASFNRCATILSWPPGKVWDEVRVAVLYEKLAFAGSPPILSYSRNGGATWIPFAYPTGGPTWYRTPTLLAVESGELRVRVEAHASLTVPAAKDRCYDVLAEDLAASALDAGESVRIQTDADFFTVDDVGSEIHLTSGAETARVRIDTWIDVRNVDGELLTPAPGGVVVGWLATWGIARSRFAGLDHLEGEEVAVLADGGEEGTFRVVEGTIDLQYPALRVLAGLPYTPTLETVPVGTSTPAKRATFRVDVDVLETRGFWAGVAGGRMYEYGERRPDDEVPTEETERIEVKIEATWSETSRIRIEQRSPFPCTIVGVTPEFEYGR